MSLSSQNSGRFVRNAWYVAAWSHELNRALLSRRILGEPVVMFRKENGTPVAFVDRCPHKLAPLSRGELVGDLIQCGYHGMQYDTSGNCVRIPGQPPIPQAAKLRRFALAEKYNAVWLWAGDPDAADPSRIVDIPEYRKPGWGLVDGQYLHFATNYLNLIDNLVDPAHTSYVHKSTIGNSGGEDVPVKVAHGDDRVLAYRWVTNAEAVPIMKKYGGFKANIDRWQYYHLYLPSISHVDFGAIDTGGELTETAKAKGFRSHTYSLLTPETWATTHYFWMHLRNYGVGDATIDADIVRVYKLTFEEDREILAAIQREQDETGVREYVKLAIDQAPMRVRRMIRHLIDSEQDRSAQTVE
jgi:phenylpropionate dioxygenase-like ring-hydroxylating dioxygenase large terminal subunit